MTNGNLVLKRKRDQWTTFTHIASGQKFRIRTCKLNPYNVDLVVEDPNFNFSVERPERKKNVGT